MMPLQFISCPNLAIFMSLMLLDLLTYHHIFISLKNTPSTSPHSLMTCGAHWSSPSSVYPLSTRIVDEDDDGALRLRGSAAASTERHATAVETVVGLSASPAPAAGGRRGGDGGRRRAGAAAGRKRKPAASALPSTASNSPARRPPFCLPCAPATHEWSLRAACDFSRIRMTS